MSSERSPGSERERRGRDGGGERRPAAFWRPVAQGLFDFSGYSVPELARPKNRILRHLPLIAAVLAGLSLVGGDTALMGARVALPVVVCALPAVAQSAAIPLALIRPPAAWWLSLAAMASYAGLSAALPGPELAGTPWPWPEPALLAHLIVTFLTAWRVRTAVFIAQWALSTAVGAVAWAFFAPPGIVPDLLPFAVVSAFGLSVLAGLRVRDEARRTLRKQQRLTEVERARRAMLEERTRIARELHDVVAHHMSVVAVQAEAAPYRVAEPPNELVESFAGIRENALAALTEMRHILGMLRDDTPDPDARYAPQPSLDNLDELLDNVRTAGLTVSAAVSGTPRTLPKRVELSAFRIVQEALSNALRHSPGSRVEVEVGYRPDAVELRVANSPATARVRRQPGSGHGVLGMRERATTLGGTLRAGRRDDGWYEVVACLPYAESERA
ncbi:two-component system sensor kinase [Streptantibioticus cattleyicolor NRRL 8057 = DSM 46488]|uniref:histidine kinase n=1 Tax=Streptantibioticus cattleyicolor (strain ATCC 35852 / DSM 46488 / JCM 4925 / NBRC 14057 / NRRL 8057) TaxID=1003195 RepID=F8K3C6_STREN|nr:two-component system sensor kinase [Streptantibioticus cattleyicolor NRRL 8057 = DSM 46488]MYS59637.1 two-component sensor histidine kinase [Streptomyces sp. SID5468]CCB75390.1 putative two-component system sensor kinase [Streptantibioticus cattleyicolor NRRL 8057 = DSM 46488]